MALEEVVGVKTSASQLQCITDEIGEELRRERDEQTNHYSAKPISEKKKTQPASRLRVAAVSIDGGRIQTRSAGSSRGVHNPRWRETKNAIFLKMFCSDFSEDPCSELPGCFASPEFLSPLLEGDVQTETTKGIGELIEKDDFESWRPEILFRTCMSSLRNSQEFGTMMEAHADSRGFYHAEKKAFVSDGMSYNWKIHEEHFSDFTPILDLIHAFGHTYRAAKAIYDCEKERWSVISEWLGQIWKGRVSEVVETLRGHLEKLGPAPEDADENHPAVVVASEIRYFENNASRMNYPEYRKEGLPITSAHMESYVKEVGRRVKGSDRFWNDGDTAENMLCLKAAMLSEGERFRNHMRNRPGQPFNRNVRGGRSLATAG